MKILTLLFVTVLSCNSFAAEQSVTPLEEQKEITLLEERKASIQIALKSFTDILHSKVADCAKIDNADTDTGYEKIMNHMDGAVEARNMSDLFVLESCIAQVSQASK